MFRALSKAAGNCLERVLLGHHRLGFPPPTSHHLDVAKPPANPPWQSQAPLGWPLDTCIWLVLCLVSTLRIGSGLGLGRGALTKMEDGTPILGILPIGIRNTLAALSGCGRNWPTALVQCHASPPRTRSRPTRPSASLRTQSVLTPGRQLDRHIIASTAAAGPIIFPIRRGRCRPLHVVR